MRAFKVIVMAGIAGLAAPATAARSETAVLAGGCFWGMEAVFEHVAGVTNVVSGYAGGSRADATYDKVSSERTRHAEAVRITYDPAKISYGRLLHIYATVAHDPTQLNRQGPDIGRSYRSAIFPQTKAQDAAARAFLARLKQSRPVVTTIERGAFYPAEAYHQDFARKNPFHPYIITHDKPKVAALKRQFPALYKG
jgi:peptide-methionine (S)-S-oxide reductase